jgi:PAS domain S-box
MWKIDQPQPGHRSFDLVAALNVLATSERHRLSAVIPRVAFVLIVIVAVDELIAGTGGLPIYYSYFLIVLLMYAGLVLPLPLALGLTTIAVAGPSHRGLLFPDAIKNEEFTVLLRPLAMVVVVTLAWVIARVIRRNVSFYEQLYASIAAHFPNGTISLFDSSLRFLISGGEGLTKIGLTPDQIVGKGPWDIFDAQGLEAELPAMQAALAGEASAFEMKFEGRDRLIRMTPVRDGSGKVVAGLSISQDITELRQAEATIRASGQRMFSFLESMPVGVFVLDADGKPFYANGLAERLLGRGIVSATCVGELAEVYEAFVAGSDEPYPSSRMPIVRALAGEASMIEDMEIARPDGRTQLQVWGAPIRNQDGQITHAVAAFSNITAQKRFEEALQESEARFRTVFEEGPLGMAIVGPDYRFRQVNQALCTLTGYTGEELVGHTFSEITHPEDHDRHLDHFVAIERGDHPVLDIEKRYLRKDGVTI